MNYSPSSIQGYDSVKEELKKLKTRKITFVIFEISQIDPVQLRVLSTGGIDSSSNLHSTPDEALLKETFENCKKQLMPTKASFVAYNFGYYNDKNNYREMVMLVSYIPEDVNLRHKIAMTTNTAVLQNTLNIPLLVEAHELDDFCFKRFFDKCLSIQRE